MKLTEALVLLLVVIVLFMAIVNTADRSGDEGRKQLESSLRRSVMACYAAEGVYPPDLEYLKEHYGLIINEDRYSVHYEAFAQNLMPDITILELEE